MIDIATRWLTVECKVLRDDGLAGLSGRQENFSQYSVSVRISLTSSDSLVTGVNHQEQPGKSRLVKARNQKYKTNNWSHSEDELLRGTTLIQIFI